MSRIVDFYRGDTRHPLGVSIETIWEWDDRQLEYEHTYIQWLFPLREPSRAVPGSPTITAAEVGEFRSDPELRERVLRSFRLMLGFYGFAMRPAADPAGGRGARGGTRRPFVRGTVLGRRRPRRPPRAQRGGADRQG